MREVTRRMLEAGVRVIRTEEEAPRPWRSYDSDPPIDVEELLRQAPPFDQQKWGEAGYSEDRTPD